MKKSEYENFDGTMKQLMRVSHSEIKAKLEAEKLEKSKKSKYRRSKDSNDKRN